MRHSAAQEGFTLLEAIVALAILAAAGLALFAAMSQSMQMVRRAQEAREADAALRNAIAWSAVLDPMDEPDGEQPLGGGWRLHWEATLVEPLHDGATGYLQPGLYQLGLYDLRLELARDGVVRREAHLRRTGFRQVRHPEAL
ncbi:MAG TPA: prepilin-type N-terminal cleavage/methylation domain-containing protein [Luteimonas sp.]